MMAIDRICSQVKPCVATDKGADVELIKDDEDDLE